NSVGRLTGDGGHDSGRDPAQHQRLSGLDGASHSRSVVQEQRLRQSAHRADDPGDALHRARGSREGSVAARRRFRRSQRSGAGAARQFQSPLRRRWQDRTATRHLPRQLRLHPRLTQDIWRPPMHCVRTPITDRRPAMRLALRTIFAVGFAALVCGCKTDQRITAAPDVPADYRLRHPISITEKDHTLQLFIGANRGSLMPGQRAELLAFGQTWRDQATGVPARSIAVRNYRVSSRVLATVRITYPRIAAQAGPCGIWPKDIGPSLNRDYFENQPNWNYGCATQRNLAAMVANPADLVQPRAETPIYAPRRTAVMEKYRLGQPTSTTEVNATPPAGKITDLGQ